MYHYQLSREHFVLVRSRATAPAVAIASGPARRLRSVRRAQNFEMSPRSRMARRAEQCLQLHWPPIGRPSGPSVRSSMVAALRMMAASCSWLPCCLDTKRR